MASVNGVSFSILNVTWHRSRHEVQQIAHFLNQGCPSDLLWPVKGGVFCLFVFTWTSLDSIRCTFSFNLDTHFFSPFIMTCFIEFYSFISGRILNIFILISFRCYSLICPLLLVNSSSNFHLIIFLSINYPQSL